MVLHCFSHLNGQYEFDSSYNKGVFFAIPVYLPSVMDNSVAKSRLRIELIIAVLYTYRCLSC